MTQSMWKLGRLAEAQPGSELLIARGGLESVLLPDACDARTLAGVVGKYAFENRPCFWRLSETISVWGQENHQGSATAEWIDASKDFVRKRFARWDDWESYLKENAHGSIFFGIYSTVAWVGHLRNSTHLMSTKSSICFITFCYGSQWVISKPTSLHYHDR